MVADTEAAYAGPGLGARKSETSSEVVQRYRGERKRDSTWPTGTGIGHIRHLDVLHRLARPRGMYDAAVTGVEPYVTDRAVEEHQIAGLKIRFGHGPAAPCLLTG